MQNCVIKIFNIIVENALLGAHFLCRLEVGKGACHRQYFVYEIQLVEFRLMMSEIKKYIAAPGACL